MPKSKKKVMARLLFIVIGLVFSISLLAQKRYVEEVTDTVSKNTYTYVIKDGLDLKIDVYLPEFDAEDHKPLLLFVHGGGFMHGNRDAENIKVFCKEMSKLGYASASMSYRLTRKGEKTEFGCDCLAQDKLNTFSAAVEDIQDATYFLINNREEFGINPHKIILMGGSAGAESVLNAGYTPENCYDLPSGPVSYAGVISMAGAIPDTSVIYHGSAIPSLLFHGTCDNLVPYATAPHHYCNKNDAGYLILHGGKTIADKLNELDVPCWLYTVCGGAHEVAGTPMKLYFDDIITFCFEYAVNETGTTRHTIIPGNQEKCNYEQFDYCSQ